MLGVLSWIIEAVVFVYVVIWIINYDEEKMAMASELERLRREKEQHKAPDEWCG